jgi:Ca-activated chloride channel family protein
MKPTRHARPWTLLLFCTLAAAQTQQPGPIRVDVNLVTVIATALDASGKPLADLSRDAFEIFEEGQLQRIDVFESETPLPLDIVLMVDTSLSTLKELRFEQEAASKFIRQVLRRGDAMAVFQFSDVVTQLAPFSGDVGLLQNAVGAMEPGAGTSMYDAIYLGAQALARRPAERRRVIILVTDAGETTSATQYEDARRAALRSEAMLYTILIRPVKSESGRNTAGEHALATITDVTGGAIYYPPSADEFSGVFDRIDRELRTQYRLGYYPVPRPPERSYRRIELRVKGCAEAAPGATDAKVSGQCLLRYRKGYFTSGATE